MKFIFKDYSFDTNTLTATFCYQLEKGVAFKERVKFSGGKNYDPVLLDKAMYLSFMLVGTSYYKTFPSQEVIIKKGNLDQWQANFFNTVYQEGLSQFEAS